MAESEPPMWPILCPLRLCTMQCIVSSCQMGTYKFVAWLARHNSGIFTLLPLYRHCEPLIGG